MTRFLKPGTSKVDYPGLVKEAVNAALSDCRVSYNKVQQACVGYVYGDSTCGQRSLYEVGMTGIPVYNVNNNCSSGSTALSLGYQMIKGGLGDCILAVGFEKMEKGSLTSKFRDRTSPLDKHLKVLSNNCPIVAAPMAAQMFGAAGQEHMTKYGTTKEHFAKIAQKNHRHSVHNQNSQNNHEYTLQEILDAPLVYGPLTRLQCCPTSNGAAAAVLASQRFVEQNGLQAQAIEIVGLEMATDPHTSLSENSCIKMVGFDMTKNAATRLYQKTSITAHDVDVVELHDCFSTNELITYEALGLCEEGKGAELVDANDNTYGGKYVINPSGGLISKGHPLGATGLAQCAELCWQLRGASGLRQVPGAKVGLQHNIGLGGAVVVALYRHGYPQLVGSHKSKL